MVMFNLHGNLERNTLWAHCINDPSSGHPQRPEVYWRVIEAFHLIWWWWWKSDGGMQDKQLLMTQAQARAGSRRARLTGVTGNYSPTNIFFKISLIIPFPFLLLAVTPIIPSGSVPNAIDLECGFNGNTKTYPNPFTACDRLAWRVFTLSTWWLISVFGSGLNIIIYYLTSNSLSRGSRSCVSPLQ